MTDRVNVALVATGLCLSAAGGVLIATGVSFTTPRAQILAASGVAAVLIVAGVRRSKRQTGRVDLFHPLVFPLAYVAVSFLAPLWVTFVKDDPVRSLAYDIPIAENTPALLGLGVVGFAAGAWVPFARRRFAPSPTHPGRLLALGRLTMLLPLGVAGQRILSGGAATRGVGQIEVSLFDTFAAMLGVLATTSVLLILAAHRLSNRKHLLSRFDWLLVIILVIAIGATGTRGDAVAVMVVLTLAQVWRRGRIRAAAAGFAAAAAFGVLVLNYRNAAQGRITESGPLRILLGDMASAGFTTGATAARVPLLFDYEYGATIIAGIVRQIPSPLAVPLFGAPSNTGAYRFRDILGLTNPNSGYGYSIPADGYLNFGPIGIFALCALVGLLAAWAYPRASFTSGRAMGLLYPLFVAALPFGLRSDFLGHTKNLLYPMIIIALAMLVARSTWAHVNPDPGSEPRAQQTFRSRPSPDLPAHR